MKTSILLSFIAVSSILVCGSSRFAALDFTVTIQGAETKNVVEEGIKPTQMTHLKINTNSEGSAVSEFDIVLARGKSPLRSEVVKGNSYDISVFRDQAKAGDRIVVNVKTVTGPQNISVAVRDVLLQIPIK